MIELELPNDFIHDAPTGYSYSVSQFKTNVLSIWLNHHEEYVYTKERVKTIWGFVKFKRTKRSTTHTYHAPINCNKVGAEVDINDTRVYTAMQILKPLTPTILNFLS